MTKISKSGIAPLQQIKSEHLIRIIDAISGNTPNTTIEVSGSVTASFFVGDGSQLTNLPTGSGGGGTGSQDLQSVLSHGTTWIKDIDNPSESTIFSIDDSILGTENGMLLYSGDRKTLFTFISGGVGMKLGEGETTGIGFEFKMPTGSNHPTYILDNTKPTRSTGSYVLATIDDIPSGSIPDLQSVLTQGNIAVDKIIQLKEDTPTNPGILNIGYFGIGINNASSIIPKSYLDTYGLHLSNIGDTAQVNLLYDGLHIATVDKTSESVIKSHPSSSGAGGILLLPVTTSGSIKTLATLSDIPTGSLDTSSLVTKTTFNNFTSSYTTGSFTGSFKGDGSQLTGIAYISPNQFSGTDSQKIQTALSASIVSNLPLKIGLNSSTGLNIWNIDTAILLKSNSNIIIDNATLKLTNSSRDNIFRTENIGFGITNPSTNPLSNIEILGIGNAILQGADNPRSTGDGGKTLSLTGVGANASYGSDTGVGGQTQTGDWRNIGILMAYTTNIKVEGLRYINTHAWANSFERCKNINISNLIFSNVRDRTVAGVGTVSCKNLDGVDFRLGCSLIIVENISGFTDDDSVACTLISNNTNTPGVYGVMEVSGGVYGGSTDDIHEIYINKINTSGRQNLVRLLNTGNTKLYNATIENVKDQATSSLQLGSTVILGSSDPTYGGTSPLGNFNNINIKNIINRFAPQAIKLENFISESTFDNIYQPSGSALNLTTGHRRLSVTNVKIDTPTAGLPNVELLASVIGTTGGRTGIYTDSGNLAYLANMSWNISTEVNLDNYQSSGFYLTPNTGLTNLPSGWTQQRYSMITVGTSNTSFRGQIIFNSLTNDMAFRTSVSGGTFSAWAVTPRIITNTTTSALSSATLTSTYPNVSPGFKVHCISISGGGLIYEKTSTGWIQYSITVVT